MLSWQTNKVQLPLQDMSSSRCTTRTCAHSSSVPSYGRPTSTPTDVDFFCGDGEPELAVPVPRWTQARFSISLPPARGSDTSCRAVSRTVTNGLAPLLCEVESGVGLLQVLNRTVSLSVSPAEPSDADRIKLERPETRPEVEKLSPSSVVTLSIQAGEVTWGQKQHQELWLLYDGEGTGEEGKTGSLGRDSSPDSSTPIKKGSDRFDFLLLWSSVASTRDTLDTSGSEIRPRVVQQEDEDHDGSNGRWLPSESNPREYSRGGHLVGELRPLNAFSAERQASLNTALETVGVDPRDLTEADEFFGSAALKAYNTFVRPRPKQLSKVIQEPVERAALRTAHQVSFLVRRHRADRAEYLRNKDASMTEAERRGLEPHPVVLVCDNVRSAYNVGSIFRSADTARVAEVITCGFTPHPGGPGEEKVRKTAFGSLESVQHRHFEDPAEAVRSLKGAGVLVCALETTENALSLFDVKFPLPPTPLDSSPLTREQEGLGRPDIVSVSRGGGGGGEGEGKGEGKGKGEGDLSPASHEMVSAGTPARLLNAAGYPGGGHAAQERLNGGINGEGCSGAKTGPIVALVMGNEVTGVDERVLDMCDAVVEVPVYGLKNSLNVASACTVVLYEVLRQWAVAGRLAGAGSSAGASALGQDKDDDHN